MKLAFALSSRFKKGEHVVIWSPNCPEWVLIEYAAAFSGIVLVTAHPALQEKELRYKDIPLLTSECDMGNEIIVCIPFPHSRHAI